MKVNTLNNNSPEFQIYFQDIPDQPKVIYRLGEPLTSAYNCIAIVGSRKPTSYGKEITYRLAFELAQAGCTIVSGLALGVDSIAHKAALDARAHTIAVLANGLDCIYPAAHRNLAKNILASRGTLISENPPGTPTMKHHFLRRNRLVSGLSLGVIITEAAQRSGSLTTAHCALDQNKTVMAIPGNITSPMSVGTNNLIQLGAIPVTSINDVFVALGISVTKPDTANTHGDTPEQTSVLQLLSDGGKDVEAIVRASKLNVSTVNHALTALELNGLVACVGGGKWVLR